MTTDALHLVLAWAAMIGGVGCGGASQVTSPTVLNAELGALPTDLKEDFQSFAVNCSKCHDLARALNAPVTEHHQWELYVKKMMRTAGSGVQALESPHILRFLFWYTDRRLGRIAATDANGQTPGAESLGGPSQADAPVVANPATAAPVAEPATAAPSAAPLLAPGTGNETQGESTP